ncbi:unnamed protein product, partial [Trichogramma brassicae]
MRGSSYAYRTYEPSCVRGRFGESRFYSRARVAATFVLERRGWLSSCSLAAAKNRQKQGARGRCSLSYSSSSTRLAPALEVSANTALFPGGAAQQKSLAKIYSNIERACRNGCLIARAICRKPQAEMRERRSITISLPLLQFEPRRSEEGRAAARSLQPPARESLATKDGINRKQRGHLDNRQGRVATLDPRCDSISLRRDVIAAAVSIESIQNIRCLARYDQLPSHVFTSYAFSRSQARSSSSLLYRSSRSNRVVMNVIENLSTAPLQISITAHIRLNNKGNVEGCAHGPPEQLVGTASNRARAYNTHGASAIGGVLRDASVFSWAGQLNGRASSKRDQWLVQARDPSTCCGASLYNYLIRHVSSGSFSAAVYELRTMRVHSRALHTSACMQPSATTHWATRVSTASNQLQYAERPRAVNVCASVRQYRQYTRGSCRQLSRRGAQRDLSTDVLQLLQLSKLCDNHIDCFQGSDEHRDRLKCTNDCTKEDGAACQNGVCLDGVCHCNDGFGGCNCQVPDENECKYRPCDIFAHCTNTLGSFQCSCYPGYRGDGFHCEDINECEDPTLAARCVENAECCNLPANFLCKCKPGYSGDGEVLCEDIDECNEHQHACGSEALCVNTPGNYTCACPPGYTGDAYSQCVDVNECDYVGACGRGALCINQPGNHRCECPKGYEGNPEIECVDVDECLKSPCGRLAQCTNLKGSFSCGCPEGMEGDPMTGCRDIDECHQNATCGANSECVNTQGSFKCECVAGYEMDFVHGCIDTNECLKSNPCATNAKCINVPGSYKCLCLQGFVGQGFTQCKNIDECEKNPCGEHAECTDTIGSFVCSCKTDYTGDPFKGCIDIDECRALENPCGANAICRNTDPGYTCDCPPGYSANPSPQVACDQTDVTTLCKSNFDCVNNAECIEGQCFCKDGFKAVGAICEDVDECATNPCGPSSVCTNTKGGFKCDCETGYIGTPPHVTCKAPCDEVTCSEHAYCKADGQEAYCICEDGWTFNPNDISAGCVDINECDTSINGPSGRCGKNALCTNTPGGFNCQCKSGYSGNALKQCLDINECSRSDVCGHGATCTNTDGSYSCTCPEETIPDPDPYTKCVGIVTCDSDSDCPGNAVCDAQKRCLCPEPNVGNDCRHPCEDLSCGPNAHCMLLNDVATCLCKAGFTGRPGVKDGCRDIDECTANPCPAGAVCNNEAGSYSCQCPSGTIGDPYNGGCEQSRLPHVCGPNTPCPAGEQCIKDEFAGGRVCICQRGFTRDSETGKCRDVNECLEPRDKPACGINAICKNLPGSYECQCPPGFNGNPFSLCEECNSIECQCQPPYKIVDGKCVLADCSKGEKCPKGAECIRIAGGVSYCACPKGYRTNEDGSCEDMDECSEGRQVCGYGAECINQPGSYQCVCPPGYGGDPYNGLCSPAQKRCSHDNECRANEKCVQPGECICPPPFYTDPYDGDSCKNPCDRFPCGLNAKCTPSDPPKCLCQAGYEGDPQYGCTDVNECANNPCGRGAYCFNTKGSHVCECPRGTSGDPYGHGCAGTPTAKQECSSNNDCENYLACVHGSCVNPCDDVPCGPNAYCEPDKHAAWCRCVIGYTENNNNECVSQCDGYVCGEGAQCIVSYDGPTCKCIEGFMGNPFPGGQCLPDVCSPDVPCHEPNLCIGGRCKCRCEGVLCGVGAMCDPQTNKCVCNPYFIGNPDYLCMPPISPPKCKPDCGRNAHCEYGATESTCVCNHGTHGNPYLGCIYQEKSDKCSAARCGIDAHCNVGAQGPECLCPAGYAGNPYIQCYDINECNGNACGNNAVCINTVGSYDCRCKDGHFGNPFVNCQRVEMGACIEPASCPCGPQLACPLQYTCVSGRCVDKCTNIKCGPRSVCQDGVCLCPPGHRGNANDLKRGCQPNGHCANDLDCKPQEICFQLGRGTRKCVDGCSKLQCGPNAFCITQNHMSSCLCVDGYSGNPSNLIEGCQPGKSSVDVSCRDNSECEPGYFCLVASNGVSECLNPCSQVSCGIHQRCEVDKKGRATCRCQDAYEWNPITSICEKPSLPDCSSDKDCSSSKSCRPDALGVLKCTSLCKSFNCALNSHCVVKNHQARCECLPGFTGNPNDRLGCQSVRRDGCESDAECAESETCRQNDVEGILSCQPVCNLLTCGPNALCVVRNHMANCECPPGPYAGNPNDMVHGCRSVPCVYNADCPPSQLCNLQKHQCYDACDKNACGLNAVCIADDHRAICQCPPGFRPNPLADIECSPVDICEPNPCHPTAVCVVGPNNSPVCQCSPNHVGDPYAVDGKGCQLKGQCSTDRDCPVHSVCQNRKCVDPCDRACGPNALCEIRNREPICKCIRNFVPTSKGAQDGCVRSTNQCSSDVECDDSVCLDGYCRAVCRFESDCAGGEKCVDKKCIVPCTNHNQCQLNQACSNNICILGCRSSRDCGSSESCIANKCKDPCKNGDVCGPNALCSSMNHTTRCECSSGFQANPTPQQGCIRVLGACKSQLDCPKHHTCMLGQCQLQCKDHEQCAQGERCSNNVCYKVCYGDSNCLPGELCIDGICEAGCTSDIGCNTNEVCINNKCRCAHGFIAGPEKCLDINECEASPCHPTANCLNLLGSYRCVCPQNTAGDPVKFGCHAPEECNVDSDCSEKQACIKQHCSDPCSYADCGANAVCSVINHVAACQCQQGYIGDASGCFKVECLSNDDCPNDKYCNSDTNKCASKLMMIKCPCNQINCGYGNCIAANHIGICKCYEGFHLVDETCVDINECLQKPCHLTALCQNTDGSFTCNCPRGLVGDPFKQGCKQPGDCFTDSDCPLTAACIDNTCRDPCSIIGTCGRNAECQMRDHVPVCRCSGQTSGDPRVECVQYECNYHSECEASSACYDHKCVDPCSVPNACGVGADCQALNHSFVCTCQPGGTGDPNLGCTPVQYCKVDQQCPTGSSCNGGICTALCTSTRDCIGDQLCIKGLCHSICRHNATCPDYQYCLNNICVQELRCVSDHDCDYDEQCVKNDVGQAQCQKACDLIGCDRNAECKAKNHNAQCSCKEGYYGKASNDKIGCQPIECSSNNDCSDEKICEMHVCRIACLAHNPCGQNAICSVKNHAQICSCQPGHTGDPKTGCYLIDHCAVSPCAPGAFCENTRGSYKCYCRQGMVGDPLEGGCHAPGECLEDEDCPLSAKCIKVKNLMKCYDACNELKCGPNSDCIADNHEGACQCRPDYEGDAYDVTIGCRPTAKYCSSSAECVGNCYENVCRPPCASDDECNLTDICSNGECLDPCKMTNACGINAHCLVKSHMKHCSCPPNFTGNSEFECVRLPVSCSDTNDCYDDHTCRHNVCLPVCSIDSDCAYNEKCVNGNCLLTCKVNNDCFLGDICLDNICMAGCVGDEDCNANEACLSNKCVNPCEVIPCGPNAKCTVINQRATCSCTLGFIPNPTAKIACLRAPGPSCIGNRDCSAGHACISGTCRPVCSSNSNCLSNERCDSSGVCKALCRIDEDCRSGDICEGLVCTSGCRSDIECQDNYSCYNNQCTDLCTLPNACGTNAGCIVVGHRKQCSCPAQLIGDPVVGCKQALLSCSKDSDCALGQSCYGKSCHATCRSDSNCLNDERCEAGLCKAICNSDEECSANQICQNRLCDIGCRSDNSCSDSESCINNKCKNPCEGGKVCGECADCRVINHSAQCNCPVNYYGNALISCTKTLIPCDGNCICDETGFCVNICTKQSHCSCGELCQEGKCRVKCDINNECAKGYTCDGGICVVGCKTHSECPSALSCSNGQCTDPCLSEQPPCGIKALCRTSNHRAICLCPDGYQGEPSKECYQLECHNDSDCEPNKRCSESGVCTNPCLQHGICGFNAQCRVVNRNAECSCPLGHYGNPKINCKKGNDECLRQPCGVNAKCRESANGFECVCEPGCQGDGFEGCLCDICRDVQCGVNAACRVYRDQPQCYCPPNYPSGDPQIACKPEKAAPDCRTVGCGKNAECIRDGTLFVCRCPPGTIGSPDQECTSDAECPNEKACINAQCLDPCTLRGACGINALCRVVLHRPRCSSTERNATDCPDCSFGTKCDEVHKVCVKAGCSSDRDCPLTETCIDEVCQEPCQLRNPCTTHAVCLNTNHGTDCSCEEGYHGNGFSLCSKVESPKNVCQYNEDCPPNKLCDRLNRRCINVCSYDTCGDNAECYVENHQARCKCLVGFDGNPEISCREILHDPCALSPCGLNALCEIDNGNPICYCPKGLTGNPFDQCIPEGDQCQNNPCGYNTGCRVVDGQATCFCLPGYEGQPPVIPCEIKNQPCNPSPCGPNTQCEVLKNGFSKCTCLSGFIESPNTIRGCVPQTDPCEPNICGAGASCDSNRNPPCICPFGTVGNPYKACLALGETLCQPGPCGENADCYVTDNQEHCYCRYGFYGDAYQGCHEPPRTPCQPSPCGPNTECKLSRDNEALCECKPSMAGDPYSPNGCDRPECIEDDECHANQACIGYRCQDACIGACGINANCFIEDHHPICRCPDGMEGNPQYRCSEPYGPPRDTLNPCVPSPCGQNTICQVISERAVCSCLPDFQGDPQTGCRQECTMNSDCATDQVCLQFKCINPCDLGTVCGGNARCKCIYHTPTCECNDGYFGNPFIRCTIKPSITFGGYNYTRPCEPSPCGDSNSCLDFTPSVAMCGTCDHQGSLNNPYCRPECLCNAECPFDQACIGWKCADPCLGSCGENSLCRVVHHTPVCSCPAGLYGDPYQGCYQVVEQEHDSCSLARCGANARCVEQNGMTTCQCEKNYFGNPYTACHLECLQNSDCKLNQACSNHKCINPCEGTCGTGASCDVINHSPVCYCDAEYTGNPFVFCKKLRYNPPSILRNPCDPSPCGPNSRCTVSSSKFATCSCLPGFRGIPPACSPECIVSSDCLQIQTCVNMKCVNPCNGVCGHSALCSVINHNPICTCPPGSTGDPFFKCYQEEERKELEPPAQPCNPSPCGPHSVCQVKMGHPVCSCQSNFIGIPPNCKPECLISQECPIEMACVSYKCVHPCPHSCGPNSECTVINHTPYCSCKQGYEGDAFVGCTLKLALPQEPSNPCDSFNCGNNALCTVHEGVPKCTCIPPYIGNPYSGCRPECMMNSDCNSNLACINQHCRDPCQGVCGVNAICEVINHIPSCSCKPGYTGEPFQSCVLEKTREEVSPCSPSPCGPYSVCRVQKDRAVCSCSDGYRGSPPFCRPECLVSSECSPELSCIRQKCTDPCQDSCGLNANCIVSNHNPICSCPKGFVGDPFTQCIREEVRKPEPCVPSPCGPNAVCRVQDSRPVCACNRGMIGAPPNCRPECLIDQDCPSYLACGQNNKCSNPCIGSCGLNAQCSVHNHRPECQCYDGYEGDPFSGCIQK